MVLRSALGPRLASRLGSGLRVTARAKVRVCLGRRIPHYDLTAKCTAPYGKSSGKVSGRVRTSLKVRIVLGVRVRVCVDR